MAKILEVTSQCMKSTSDRVGASAFEFWTTLAEAELEREEKNEVGKNYIQECKGQLVQLVLDGLLVINFEEDADD